jgi:hypothetical protein
MYHQEAALEEQQESETVRPNTMDARLFTAVELSGSMEVNQQTVTAAAHDYTVMDINKPHVDQICEEASQEVELLGSERKPCRQTELDRKKNVKRELEPNS